MRGRVFSAALVAAAAVVAAACTPPPSPPTVSRQGSQTPAPAGTPARPFTPGPPGTSDAPSPPTTQTCLEQTKAACYTPAQLARAYDLEPLWRAGWTGAGRTVAIVDSFGSPTIREDLHAFDAAFGYPDPKLTIIQPAGQVPLFDGKNSDHTGWAGETTLDVEWAHAMAPGADILLVETPVAETEGITGFPEIVKAETYLLDHHLADVISHSLGATERTFDSPAQLRSQRSTFVRAAAEGVTVLAASGDDGAAAVDLHEHLLPVRGVEWPASDPLVTAVGGTKLSLDAAGARTAPDTTWHDPHGASGGGLSEVFPRPAWQDGVKNVVGRARGVPDISMSAAVSAGVLAYSSYDPSARGWTVVGGTSVSTPLFAGVVAIADQMAGRRLGLLNPRLYALAKDASSRSGIVDVTTGDNTIGRARGFPARRGYDLTTGFGTVDADRFVRALVGK
jgi:subtilase family serine protease